MDNTNLAFKEIFTRLKNILLLYAPGLLVKADTPVNYSLDTPYTERYRKELFFGAVQVKKNYVSFYLMPVYIFPDLLEGISAPLKQRMQGKSCFNFKKEDEALFTELSQLAAKSAERMRQEGLLGK
jgi:hypothetical protein